MCTVWQHSAAVWAAAIARLKDWLGPLLVSFSFTSRWLCWYHRAGWQSCDMNATPRLKAGVRKFLTQEHKSKTSHPVTLASGAHHLLILLYKSLQFPISVTEVCVLHEISFRCMKYPSAVFQRIIITYTPSPTFCFNPWFSKTGKSKQNMLNYVHILSSFLLAYTIAIISDISCSIAIAFTCTGSQFCVLHHPLNCYFWCFWCLKDNFLCFDKLQGHTRLAYFSSHI